MNSSSMTDPLVAELFRASPDGVVVVDESGTIVMANPLAAEMFHTTEEDLVGRSVEDLVPPTKRVDHAAHRGGYARHSERRAMGLGLDLTAHRPDGTAFPADISLSPLELGGRRLVLASVRDISERRMAERELRAANERIVMMEDRERIARDLHDVVIQEIFAAGLHLQAVVGRVADDEAATRIAETAERLDETITKLRGVIFDLQRARRRSSLEAALDDVLIGATDQLGFEPRLRLVGITGATIPPTLANDLLLTVREALTNVGKHANASTTSVAINAGDELILVVIDDGVGFEPGDEPGFGLRNMSERAESSGGNLTIGPAERGGTRLVWRVPLR